MQSVIPPRLAAARSAMSGPSRLAVARHTRSALASHATARVRSASTSPYSHSVDAQVTILPNKVRVTTESTPGHFQALGVYIDAGSRFETMRNSGTSHLLDRMAFKATADFSAEEMTKLIDSLGSNILCSSSRETIMYQSTIFPENLPLAMKLIASTVRNSLVDPVELDAQKEAAAYEIREIWAKPELILPELVHHVAYQDNTLGMPLLCPEEQLDVLDRETLRSFMRDWYRPERMVVAGVGMEHDQLVRLAEEHFGSLGSTEIYPRESGRIEEIEEDVIKSTSRSSTHQPSLLPTPPPTPPTSPSLSKSFATTSTPSVRELASAQARYTGGQMMIPKPDQEFTHVYIAFEGLGIHDPDIYALATLQMLLGGGGSFSAGGPGKGMYSRLYTNVLNIHHSVDYCASFHHCYADSGLFGIAASVSPHFTSRITDIIAAQLDQLTRPMRGGVTENELKRAKNQLKSSLVMALESRTVEVEDLGRQTQIHGKKVPVEEMCAKIDAVSLSDLHRTATRVLRPAESSSPLNYGLGSGEPTIVAHGHLDGLGDIRETLRQWGLGAGVSRPKMKSRIW